MREPTPDAVSYAWWLAAVSGERLPTHENEVHCGLFKKRLVARGPWVPASIYIERTVCPETGELLSDEKLRCEINGHPADPFEAWVWLAKHPVDQTEYDDLKLMAMEMSNV